MEMQAKTVAYNADNIMKCQCTSCPVQAASSCVMAKKQAIAPMMEQMSGTMGDGATMMSEQSGMGGMMLPPAADMPGMYCSTGVATCTDLDFAQGCICPSCPVYMNNSLDNTKYCKKGSATQVG